MPLELIGAGEALATKQPVTDERSLPGVPTQMRFEVRGLAVYLSAAGNVATVEPLSAQVGPCGPQPIRLLTVWTVTGCSARVPPVG